MIGVKNLFPYEEHYAPLGFFDTGSKGYVLAKDVLYKTLDAGGEETKRRAHDLIILFQKLKRMVDSSSIGIPTTFIRRMCESGKIDPIDLAILCLLGLIGEMESPVYLNDRVLFINVDSEFIIDKAMVEYIEEASENTVESLVSEIMAEIENSKVIETTERVQLIGISSKNEISGCIGAGV